MGFIEEERRKREDESARIDRKLREDVAKMERDASKRREADEKADKILAQSGFVSLLKELSSVVRGEVMVDRYPSLGNSVVNLIFGFDRDSYTQKMINILANQNGIIRVTGGLLGTTTLSPNEWSNPQKREQALEKAFKHPKSIPYIRRDNTPA